MPYVTINTKVQKIVRGVPGPPGDPTQPFTSIKMDTTTGEPAIPIQGEMWWDIEEETYSVKQDGATLQVGQEVQWPVSNKTGSTILDGTAVMAIGTVGATGRILIAPMDGITPANAKFLLGVATHDIGNNEQGKVTAFGKVRDMDTTGASEGETWADEDILWISDSVAGQLTNIQPDRDSIGMPVAFVINANANVGVLSIRITPINEHLLVTEDQRDALDSSNTPTALNPIATVVDLEWYVDQTLDVTGSAVQEVLFTGLDFTTYEYRLQGVIEASAPGNSFNLRWYSTEATAAAVVGTEYISTMFRRNPSEQSFIANLNHFWYGQTSSGRIQVNDWRFFRDADGYTRMWGIDAFQLYSTTLSNFMAFSSSWNDNTTALSTKIGIYHTAANFFNVGTMLNLWRRKL